MVTLVTGANGFLGRHIAETLSGAGVQVVPAGRPEIEIPSPRVDRIVSDVGPYVVVHCAGPASVQLSLADPERDRHGSVEVTGALVASLDRVEPPPRLVLLSSAAVYVEPKKLPVSETSEPSPISPYGQHRLAAERLVRSSALPSCVLRVFSAYGEGLRRQILWDIVMRALAGSEVALSGTGDETRDFVHARDVAAAVKTACEHGAFAGEVINVASGEETTIRELATRVVEAL